MNFAPYYSKSMLNIKTGGHFALRLGFPEDMLRKLASKSSQQYKPDRKKPKASGGFRVTNEPKPVLKDVQKKVNRLLQEIKLPDNFYGSVKHKSHIENARQHIHKKFVACFDIRDYFSSIHYERIKETFKRLGCSSEVASVLANLTSYKHHLPQGAPASSTIANLVFAEHEKRFSNLANRFGSKVTFYQDDICFSGSYNLSKLKNLIRKMIRQIGFRTQERKVKIRTKNQKQIVTGLVVNEGPIPTIPEEYIRDLNRDILSYGIGEESENMSPDSLQGKIRYVESVSRKEGNKLRDKFYRAGQERKNSQDVSILQRQTV